HLWMIYGSWFGGIYMLELDENTGLRDYNINYETVTNVSDAYMGKKVAGGYYASGEGPYIEYMKAPDSNKGYYYLFLSYGYFNSNGGYNMRVFRSENPDGPYVDQNGNSAIYTTWSGDVNTGGTVGQRLMSNYQWNCNDRPNKAQGHNSALMDDDGKLYVIYHNKFDDAYGFHEIRVHQMFLNQDGWLVTAPYEYSGETISETGHTIEAITGEYEFIFHTLEQEFVNETSADVETSKNISINADGTITGDINGTWSVQEGASYVTIIYNNTEYKGNFLVQADESNDMIQKMTFTATGNNTCIWGSKITAYDASIDNIDLINYDSNLVYHADSATGTGNNIKRGETELLSGVAYF
ncbi:MAG: glycoside hydrolase family 43 protein, partial [Oscillospiraceae bacterium]|nr:glycoside hydrolase family 43 protein [Oscillospiraceae bacterium]